MPVTRSRSGKLPVKSSKNLSISSDEDDFDMEESSIIVNPEKPVFQTIQTDANLPSGLCLMRKLDDGKMEIIDFSQIPFYRMGSEEIGQAIKLVPGRLELFENALKELKSIESKIGQGFATDKIFRFLKLPIELRNMVYTILVKSSSTVHLRYGHGPTDLTLAIRATCRQIYDEASPIFYRNNFRFYEVPKDPLAIISFEKLGVNMREVTFEWWAFVQKDKHALRMIGSFPKLEILHIVITRWCVGDLRRPRRQRLHQNDNSISKFSKTAGFDEIASIRGLKKVTVSFSTTNGPFRGSVSDAQLRTFEDFLNRELTQPKPKLQPAAAKRRSAGATKSKKSKRSRANDDEDDYLP
ncbi:hypothetical protein G7Y89_g13321 [Cudoniella acicularis]|uniref:F-box domain-containing protein n=1 Tax=Cudoniella acicularis TaxID=354080 RepID=A0A8H4R9U3_9HELO|nr:hypothetical protein G7Y89_g13321 [Cudoniella acicularis]